MSGNEKGGPAASMPPTELRRVPVAVEGAPFIQGEIKLSDGTVLRVMLVIPVVSRLEGAIDSTGNPMYELQTTVAMGVVKNGGGR